MIDVELLRDTIRRSGLKISFICDALGITREAWRFKIKGQREFKVSEMKILCEVLALTPEERDKIFFA